MLTISYRIHYEIKKETSAFTGDPLYQICFIVLSQWTMPLNLASP
jgi:hypothetical protein